MSIEKEVLKQLTPLLSRNLDLGDYDVIEQLHADDVITLSDEERYVEPYKRNKGKPGDCLGLCQRTVLGLQNLENVPNNKFRCSLSSKVIAWSSIFHSPLPVKANLPSLMK